MTAASLPFTRREPELLGQTVLVIGGSAGIGFETARRARGEGANIILTGRNSERLEQAARELGAQRVATFDANDLASLEAFFRELPGAIDHVMVTGRRSPLRAAARHAARRGPARPDGAFDARARRCSRRLG